MKIRNIVLSTLTVTAISATFAGAASAAVINFDQDTQGATGNLNYDGEGGALTGSNISFSFVSTEDTDKLNCLDCTLNFTTGSNVSEGMNYIFNGGGSFSLDGTVATTGGDTIASGNLLTGTFDNGGANFIKSNRGNGGFFTGEGSNTVNNDFAAFYGLNGDSIFNFLTTEFSIGQLDFSENGGFSGNVTAADLQTESMDVPEPQELAIFGLGVFLLVGGLAYRRKTGAGDLIG